MLALEQEEAETPLDARAWDLRARIDDLRLAEGAALLDGGAVDASARLAAEAELAAVEAAMDEAARRERAIAEKATAKRERELRLEIGRLDAARRVSIGEAETAARAMVAALAKAEGLRAKEARAFHELGKAPLAVLNHHEANNRLSWHLSALLEDLGQRGRFGNIRLHTGWVKPGDPWFTGEPLTITGKDTE